MGNELTTTKGIPSLLFLAIFMCLVIQAPGVSAYLISPDSGYQLGLGSQVMLGKLPYIDLVFHYGPLVAYTSALCQWLTGNLVAEIFMCSLGYAASLCLVFLLVRRPAARFWPYGTVIIGYLLLARFYKWYYWFFPLALLYFIGRILRENRADRSRYIVLLFAAGIVSGLGALFRFDLGMVLVCCFIICQLLSLAFRFTLPMGYWQSQGVYLCGLLLPLGSWLAVLLLNGGLSAVRQYFDAILSGGSGVVAHWGISLPTFDWSAPFSTHSAITAALTLLPVVYICCIGFGFYGMKNYDSFQEKNDNLLLAAIGIMGLGIYPQGYYRADASHVLQVIPPVLAAIPLLVSLHWKGFDGARFRHVSRRMLFVGVILWGCIVFIGLLPHGGKDLSGLSPQGMSRLRQLAEPLNQGTVSLPKRPAALQALMNSVITATRPADHILVVPLLPQVYYFTRRPMSGLLIGYARGIHDTPSWRERNLEAVKATPPEAVIAGSGFLTMEQNAPFRQSQPELYSYLAANYRETMYENDGWLVLGRSEQSD